jgi:hypothetical protein
MADIGPRRRIIEVPEHHVPIPRQIPVPTEPPAPAQPTPETVPAAP